MSKIDVKEKELTIKFDADVKVSDVEWKAGESIKLKIEETKGLEDKDWKNETKISDKLKGKLTGKDKNNEEQKDKPVENIEVEYTRGWFTNSLRIKEVDSKKLKEAADISIGGDFGINWGGWGIVAIILIGLSAIGYYWWSISKQEEEEENV